MRNFHFRKNRFFRILIHNETIMEAGKGSMIFLGNLIPIKIWDIYKILFENQRNKKIITRNWLNILFITKIIIKYEFEIGIVLVPFF